MPIDIKNTAYGQLNDRLIVAYNTNYGVLRVIAQEKKADDAEARGEISISGFASEWFRNKRDAYAEHRAMVLEKYRENLDVIVQHHLDGYKAAKQRFEDELASRFPGRKFEDMVRDSEIIDDEVLQAYQAEAMQEATITENGTVITPETPLGNAYVEYLEKRGTYKIAESVSYVFDNIAEDIDYRGYQHLLTQRNDNANVKIVDADFISEFYSFAKSIPATYKTELIKTQSQLRKLTKKLQKDPENPELQSLVYGHQYSVEFCQDVLERSDYLVMMSQLLKDRMDAVNIEPYGIRDKVVETLADFVFMIPSVSKGKASYPTFNTMYMGTYEIKNLINCVKEFPEAAVFTQYLSAKIEHETIMSAQDFERSKIMMDFLLELHKMNAQTIQQNALANGETVTPEEVKAKATNQDNARYLQFETPLGRVWCNGENLVDVKTGKVVPFAEICKYVLNPNDGNIYYLQTEEEIKPGTVTLVGSEKVAGKENDGMGKK